MGTKYSSVSISGYNSSPPSDDGATTEANKVKWATIKTKLNDPVKTAVESINTAIGTALDESATSKTTDYTTVAGDHNKTVEIAAAASTGVTISLGDAATMAAGYRVTVSNQSAHTQTVGRETVGNTIDGVAGNFSILRGQSATFLVNAAGNGYDTLSTEGARVKVLASSRTMTAASGSVAYTGVGFRPRLIRVMAIVNNSTIICWGTADAATQYCMFGALDSTNFFSGSSTFIYLGDAGAANSQTAVVTSYDADGFTLNWTKVGSPTGTGVLTFECYR